MISCTSPAIRSCSIRSPLVPGSSAIGGCVWYYVWYYVSQSYSGKIRVFHDSKRSVRSFRCDVTFYVVRRGLVAKDVLSVGCSDVPRSFSIDVRAESTYS